MKADVALLGGGGFQPFSTLVSSWFFFNVVYK